jgi:heptose-I-phosphate ethanolaminephosphotransferase
VVAIELFMLAYLDSRLTSSYIGIILGEYRHLEDFWGIWSQHIIVSTLLFFSFYTLLILNLKKITFQSNRYFASVSFFALVGLYGVVTVYQMKKEDLSFNNALVDVIARDKNSPFGVISQSYTSYSVMKLSEKNRELRKDFSFGAQSKHSKAQPELHILILGESSSPMRWQLNGYHRETTPRLSVNENLISFSNAIAEAALTKLSVPLIITRETIKDRLSPNNSVVEKSIVTAFSEAGYKTAWLSGVQMDTYTGEINDFAHEADTKRFFERRHDGVMLQGLKDMLEHLSGNDKAFIVMHTQGSHFDYTRRYPESFNQFQSDANATRKQRINNQYDNSILYTDFFIQEVINTAKQFAGVSSVFYTSDHGQNLLDDERKLLGHFQNNEYDLPTAMIFWGSQQYRDQYPQTYNSLRLNADKKISTHSVFSTLLDIGSIEIEGTDMSKSLARRTFEGGTRYIIKDDELVDYDVWYENIKGKKYNISDE